MLLTVVPSLPPATPTQTSEFLDGIIQQMLDTWSGIETFLSSITIGPLTLWQWILASFAITVIFAAVKLLTGHVSLTFTSMFHRAEEGRFHKNEKPESGGKK